MKQKKQETIKETPITAWSIAEFADSRQDGVSAEAKLARFLNENMIKEFGVLRSSDRSISICYHL